MVKYVAPGEESTVSNGSLFVGRSAVGALVSKGYLILSPPTVNCDLSFSTAKKKQNYFFLNFGTDMFPGSGSILKRSSVSNLIPSF